MAVPQTPPATAVIPSPLLSAAVEPGAVFQRDGGQPTTNNNGKNEEEEEEEEEEDEDHDETSGGVSTCVMTLSAHPPSDPSAHH